MMGSTEIDYLGVLDYLQENRELPYMDPDKVEGDERAHFLEMKKNGDHAVGELKRLSDICENKYALRLVTNISWLLAGSKTRKTLSVQMKYPEYEEEPAFVAVYVEYDEELGARYRVGLDIKNDVADKKTMEQYHSFLNLPIDKGSGLIYVVKTNKWGNPIPIDQSRESLRDAVNSHEMAKVQICSYVKDYASNDEYSEALLAAVENILPYYEHVIGAEDYRKHILDDVEDDKAAWSESMNRISKNTILYGPPGTGKTYNTLAFSIAIIENRSLEDVKDEVLKDYDAVKKRFEDYKDAGQIAFTTFHQSYGYEEFIEGIKPKLSEDTEDIKYSIEPGVFKKFCRDAQKPDVDDFVYGLAKKQPRIWGMILGGTGMPKIKADCFEKDVIRIGFSEVDDKDIQDGYGTDEKSSYSAKRMVDDFINTMEKGDIVVIEKTNKSIDAIGIVAGDYYYDGSKPEYPRTRAVKWITNTIDQDITKFLPEGRKQMARNSLFSFDYIGIDAIFKILALNDVEDSFALEYDKKPHVFIIDEINRGNISKIFGELITLIEDTKRKGCLEAANALLPYSHEEFSVPDNVYILGTMNTADRSIALMDTALRRRFDFVEMMPDESILDGIVVSAGGEAVDVASMLHVINERIEYLYDREHTIGHAFFIKLKEMPTLDTLSEIFKNKVVPLLQEYFYEDYGKIQLVLGDNMKSSDEYKFIRDIDYGNKKLFNGTPDIDDLPDKKYRIQEMAFDHIESYKEIGEGI